MFEFNSLKQHIIITFILFSIFILWGNFAFADNINKIRFGHPQTDIFRIVIETNKKYKFNAFTLSSPNRLVIDIFATDIVFNDFKTPSNSPIKDYKYGKPDSKTSRIVFKLKYDFNIVKKFALPADGKIANRIVVDITKAKRSNKKAQLAPVKNTPLTKENKIISVVNKYQQYLNLQKETTKPKNITEIIKANDLAAPISNIIPSKKPKIINIDGKYIIAIDAGHGGKDPGATNGRFVEKNITLALAKMLKIELLKTGKYKVVMTREKDKFLKLRQRVNIARKAGADLFISIHADKIARKNVRGSSVYTLSEKASDKESAKLAKRENDADIIAGIDLSHEDEDVADILIDIAIRDTVNNSNILANSIVKKFRKNKLRLLKKAHRSAGFAVLKAPDIPSVLIETGFISNLREAKLLTSYEHQQKISLALIESIDEFFYKLEQASLH